MPHMQIVRWCDKVPSLLAMKSRLAAATATQPLAGLQFPSSRFPPSRWFSFQFSSRFLTSLLAHDGLVFSFHPGSLLLCLRWNPGVLLCSLLCLRWNPACDEVQVTIHTAASIGFIQVPCLRWIPGWLHNHLPWLTSFYTLFKSKKLTYQFVWSLEPISAALVSHRLILAELET